MRKYFGKRLFSGGQDATLREVLAGDCEEHTLGILEEWMHALKESAISPLVVYEALDSIEEDLAGMPSVTLYVPVHFNAEHVERFGTWFRQEVQPNILLTVRTDPRVVGGCGFIWNHIYYDFSLRYFMNKESATMTGMFDRYTHAK
jgi:hypothetical protein